MTELLVQAYIRSLPLDPEKLDRALRNAMRDFAETMQRDFQETVQTWETRVDFPIWGPAKRGDHMTVRVGPRPGAPSTLIWQGVDEGTRSAGLQRMPKGRAFPIRPYAAKTVPGRVRSGPGGYAGSGASRGQYYTKGRSALSSVALRRTTTHVGIQARGFTQAIVSKYDNNRWDGVLERIRRSLDPSFKVSAEVMRIR